MQHVGKAWKRSSWLKRGVSLSEQELNRSKKERKTQKYFLSLKQKRAASTVGSGRDFRDPNDILTETKKYYEKLYTTDNPSRYLLFSSSRMSDGQSSLADKCCSPLQIREAAVERLGLQGWLGPGPHSQFFKQLTPL